MTEDDERKVLIELDDSSRRLQLGCLVMLVVTAVLGVVSLFA